MTIEASQYINQLNTTFPRSTDLLKEGDDHIRLIKANLKNTFPAFTGSTTISNSDLNNIKMGITASPTSLNFNQGFKVSGGKNVDMGGNIIHNVGNPTANTDAANLNYVQALVRLWFADMYPVGAVFCTGTVNKNPQTMQFFSGQTWVPWAVGTYIGAIGNNANGYNWSGGEGGSKSITIATGNLPAHSHTIGRWGITASGTTSTTGNHQHATGWGENSSTTGAPYGRTNSTQNHRGSGETDWDNQEFLTSVAGNHNHTVTVTGSINAGAHTDNTGSGAAITNMPRVTVAYWWRRTK